MSEFLAEARVLVVPDTSKFRAELQAQLLAATRGTVVPITVAPVVGGGLGPATAGFARLTEVQSQLRTTSESTAGALKTLDENAKKSTASLLGAGSATARLDAALLGLRTAVGSTAVIGLGALALAAIAAGKAVSASIQNFIQFQQELAVFRVTANATADDMKRVSDAAVALGKDVTLPGVSAGDAAIAMTELAKAGLSVEDAIAGARGVLQLATAAQISNAEASQIAANALNSFGLAGDQAVRVADDLANAANAAQGSISDFGFAFAQASAVARQVGLSLEDTTALLSLFARNGLQGSDAGTSLRVALIRLVAPSKDAAAEIKKLGLNIRDAQGNVRPDVFAQFGEATKNLSPAARDAAAALIFGQDAIRAVAIGAREGEAGLRLMQFQIDQTGTAAELAAARTQGLGGSFSALSSSAETISVRFGKLISLGLKPYVDAANLALVATNELAEGIDNLVTAALNADTPLGKVKDRMFDIASVGIPLVGEVRLIKKGIDALGIGSDETAEKIKLLQKEESNLEKARIAAQAGGQEGLADKLTKTLKRLRDEIKLLENEGKGITGDVTKPLRDALAELEKARDIRLSLDVDTSGIERLIARLKEQIPITQHVEGNFARLSDDTLALRNRMKDAADNGVDALTRALKGLASQSAVAQAELLKLQTEGGTPQQQIAVLQEDIATQFEIIARQKARGGAPGAATAIKEARERIKADQAEVASLQAQITADAKKAADEAEKARDEQDAALLRQFEAVTTPISRLLDRAALTEPLKDDIKFTTQLIVLYRQQIVQATKRIQDAETRNRILKTLGDKLLDAILDRKRLQQQERQRIRDALKEKLERIQTGIQLDIELADLNENTKRSINLRLKLIAQLKKEAKVLHLQGNALKENRNERARLRKEIEDLQKEEKKGKTFAQSAFEFAQSLQGFSANLLGNLIPGFATGGLVGGSTPAAPQRPRDIGVEAQQASVLRAAETRGVRPVQVDTTNAILRQILAAIQGRPTSPPEIAENRRSGSAVFDTL